MTVPDADLPTPPVPVDGRPVRALLADGTVVRVRELAPADAPLVAALYGRLPVYDRFLRFFSAGALPAQEDLIVRVCLAIMLASAISIAFTVPSL